MITLPLPRISRADGPNSDGFLLGTNPLSLLQNAITDIDISYTITVIRKNMVGSQEVYEDVSTLAMSGTSNAFEPFGPLANLVAGDELWVADSDIGGLILDVTTAGVYTGGTLEVLHSTDGSTLTACPSLVDPSNALRNTGRHNVTFGGSADRKSIAPRFGMTARKYVVLRLSGVSGATVAPALARIWGIDAAVGNFLDLTAMHSSAVSDATFDEVPGFDTSAVIFTVGASVYYGFPKKPIGVDDYYHVFGTAGARTVANEYLSDTLTWTTLPNVSGAAPIADPGGSGAQIIRVRFTVPADWTKQTFNGLSLYWFRSRTATVIISGPVTPPLFRRRVIALEDSNGLALNGAKTISKIDYRIGVPHTADIRIGIAGAVSGNASEFVIPANSTHSANGITLSPPLVLAANDQLVVWQISASGTLQDVDLFFD